jgi:cytochrome c-type biogenesis protein CcmH
MSVIDTSSSEVRRGDASSAARVRASKAQYDALCARLANGEISAEDFDDQARELSAGLLDDVGAAPGPAGVPRLSPRSALALLLLAAVVAAVTYLGTDPAPTDPVRATTDTVATPASNAVDRPAHALSDDQLQRMIEQASTQTRQKPDDASAWALLAHSYDMLGKFAESSKAYAQLVKLAPNDAQAYADYADALAVASGRTLEGEPGVLLKRALAIDPRNVKALALTGTAAFERNDYDAAIASWQRAAQASTDPAFKAQLEGSIAEASAASRGEHDEGSATAGAPPAHPGAADATVSGRVSLADDLVAKVSPDATVYVFARPAKGTSRMPVAILRKKGRDLPLDFRLDDSMSMVPDAKLSQQTSVVIGARVSQRGDVSPQPGDMQGWSAPVDVGAGGIRLEISEVLK